MRALRGRFVIKQRLVTEFRQTIMPEATFTFVCVRESSE
jgi:hypothetical protein